MTHDLQREIKVRVASASPTTKLIFRKGLHSKCWLDVRKDPILRLRRKCCLLVHEKVERSRFNQDAILPYSLRLNDFEIAMQDVYDFFFDVNTLFYDKGLPRLDDTLRPAIMSGLISDMLTSSVAKHSRTLVQNQYFNGHPDLLMSGRHPNNAAQAADEGIEIKTTRKKGGAVDTHGGRNQWMCIFVY